MSDYVREKYLAMLIPNLDIDPKSVNTPELNFSCPYCKEGKSLGRKRRAFIYKETGYNFLCYNCGVANNFEWFLRDQDNNLFKQYFVENKSDLIKEYLKPTKKEKKEEVPADTSDGLTYMWFDSDFIPVIQNNEALAYVKKRKIPKKFWDDIWYYTKPNEAYSNSIIFPFRKDGEMYGFSSRNIYNKFFHIELPSKSNHKLWNYYGVNKSLNVYIFESIIDALYMDNSMAMNGSSITKKFLAEFISPILVFDNDTDGSKTGVKKAMKYAKMGYKIFIMPVELNKYKDMNELICAGFPPEKVEKLITKNVHQGKTAELILALRFKI
jgi:hypothetical protein